MVGSVWPWGRLPRGMSRFLRGCLLSMPMQSKPDARVLIVAGCVALVTTNWLVAVAGGGHASSYALQVGAAIGVLLFERVVRRGAPSPFGWVRWRRSLRHGLQVAAVSIAVVFAWIATVVVIARFGGLDLDLEPQNIRSPDGLWYWLWIGVVIAPLVEEWIYRGLIQSRLREVLGPRSAIFVCGLLFWVYHWVPRGHVTAPHHLLAGWLFAWSWQRTGSLVAPTLLHALANFCVGLADVLLLTQPRLLGFLLGH